MNSADLSPIDQLAALSAADAEWVATELRARVGDDGIRKLLRDPRLTLRGKQRAAFEEGWTWHVVCTGRQFGKTYMGMMALAEAVNVLGVKRSLIIGKTYDDFANLIVTGGSGIGILPEPPEVRWRPPSLRWPNGAITYFKSADSPGGTYGSSVGFIWMDECADYPTRKGRCIWDDVTHIASESKPLILATTSPYERGASIGRVAALVKQEGPDVKVTRGTSFENTALSPAYFELQKRQHDGKRAFESMVMGEILDALQGAIWSGAHIRGARLALTPAMRKRLIARCDRIVVAVDPAGVASAEGSATGVVVAGRVRKRNGRHHAFVFESLALRSRAEDWALDVARLYGEYGADIVIAERNQGGMYIEGDIAGGARAAGVSLRYQSIVSRGGKGERAMPFRARYQDGLVHHVVEGKWVKREDGKWRIQVSAQEAERHGQLEGEMLALTDPVESHEPNDVVDALVFALQHLLEAPSHGTLRVG